MFEGKIGTALFFAIFAFVSILIVTIVMFAITGWIDHKQECLRLMMEDNRRSIYC